MLTRDTGIPASQHIGIIDEVNALNFNFAVTYRLYLLREEERKALAKETVHYISKWWHGQSDDSETADDIDEAALEAVIARRSHKSKPKNADAN